MQAHQKKVSSIDQTALGPAFDQLEKTSFQENPHRSPCHANPFSASSPFFEVGSQRDDSGNISLLVARPGHCTFTPCTGWSPSPSPPSSSSSSRPGSPSPPTASCPAGSELRRASVVGRVCRWRQEHADVELLEAQRKPTWTRMWRLASASPSPSRSWRQKPSSTHPSPSQPRFEERVRIIKRKQFFQEVFNFTGRQIEVQGRNIQERTTIYTKLETVGQVLSFLQFKMSFFLK